MYAKGVGRRWLLLTGLIGMGAWGGMSLAQEKKPEQSKPKDVVDVAMEGANCKTFCKLLKSAGLEETLRGKGPYTLFVPTDEAFQKLGKELDELQKPENQAKLQRVLKNHVLEGRKLGAEIRSMKIAKTMAGVEIPVTVKEAVVMLDKATLGKSDIMASNGLLHMIDMVLMPPAQPEKKP